MVRGIAVAGANGSGKTVLGRRLAALLGYRHLDAEDYSFGPSSVPYTNPRPQREVRERLFAEIETCGRFVLSAVNCDFGEAINATYGCAVYIQAPLCVRLARIQQRSARQFGSRVLEGGDMYGQEQRFYSFVASRTMEPAEAWLRGLDCPVIRVDGTQPVEDNAKMLKTRIAGLIPAKNRVLGGQGERGAGDS